MTGPWIERNTWPDVVAAIEARKRGEAVVDGHAIDRYLDIPDAERPGMKALDCCCGVGQGALILHRKGYYVHAFDNCADAAKFLGPRGPRFCLASFEEFQSEKRYDLIAACECLEHLDDPAAALEKIRSWLAPGGRLYVTVPIEADRPRNPFHKHVWNEAQARALFAGWRVYSERLYEGYILGLELKPGECARAVLGRGPTAPLAWRPGARPKVSCVCPTYGRVTTLGEALDSFLIQTYAPRELVILNDAPKAITEVRGLRQVARADCGGGHWTAGPGVDVVVHNAALFPTLGHKYAALLELATGDVIAHWEDDDLWFPNHIETCVWRLLRKPGIECVRNESAWVLERQGKGAAWRYAGTSRNMFESQMVFRREAAREIGYAPCHLRQSLHLLQKLIARGRTEHGSIHPWNTYVFRWDTTFLHGELIGVDGWTIDKWRETNTDFGSVLKRRSCLPYLRLVLKDLDAPTANPALSSDDAGLVRGWLGRYARRG